MRPRFLFRAFTNVRSRPVYVTEHENKDACHMIATLLVTLTFALVLLSSAFIGTAAGFLSRNGGADLSAAFLVGAKAFATALSLSLTGLAVLVALLSAVR
jgi:hypothetical protein